LHIIQLLQVRAFLGQVQSIAADHEHHVRSGASHRALYYLRVDQVFASL
jgi:hypothetical protein